MRVTRGNLGLHWMLEGYNRRVEAAPGEAGVRNLMGFVDGTANLDPDDGLAFVSFQRSLERQFLPVQARLAGEPLEEYLLPEGGGFFFALPGTPDEGGYLGEGLFR